MIAGLDVMMPVARAFALHRSRKFPGGDIREASREVRFDPPANRLPWRPDSRLGRREILDGTGRSRRPGQDFRRQQLLLAVLLGDGADLSGVLDYADEFDQTSKAALGELAAVRSDWTFETLGPLTPRPN